MKLEAAGFVLGYALPRVLAALAWSKTSPSPKSCLKVLALLAAASFIGAGFFWIRGRPD